MSAIEFATLLAHAESDTLDFKETQYDFAGETREERLRKRGLFVKDILCMKNTPRTDSAFIVLGVRCRDHQKDLVGVVGHVDDATLQQQFERLVHPHPKFRYIPVSHEGKQFGVIEIPADRSIGPCIPIKDIRGAGLRENGIYVRRNSRNSEADHAEAKNVWQWFNESSSLPLIPHESPRPTQPLPKVVVLIPGYAEWSGPGKQRASGTVTLIKGTTNVLVDTGVPIQKRKIVERLRENGLKPSDINVVVITHGQLDHIGNNNLFPKAKFILDTDVSTGDEYSVHDFHQDAFHIDEGIYAIATPGHTDHDITVVVETEDGTVAIAGDLFEKEGDWADGSWEAWSKKRNEQRVSREKILRVAEHIVPGHGDIFHVPPLTSLNLPPGIQDLQEQKAFFRKHPALIAELARRFQTHWDRVDEDKIKNWLSQFGDYLSITSVFPLLQHIDYIDEGRISDLFSEFYEKISKSNGKDIVFSRLGGGKDSTSLIGYFCSKAFNEKQRRTIPFENIEALAGTRDPEKTTVIFLDDTIGSGNQSIRIFGEWLGVSDEELQHVHRLTGKAEAWLRKANLSYFALIGFREGKEKLGDFLASQNIAVRIHTAITLEESMGCFDANSLIFDNPQVRLHAKKIAEEIGTQLFADREDWSSEKQQAMALGYGGAQKLIVFSYNTPNCTLPILWKKGVFNGKPWIPLFPRRD